MFKKQQYLLNAFENVRGLIQTYGLDNEWLNPIERDCTDFYVRVPLVGAFSSGKSSLLNALIESKLLAVDITP